MIITAVKIRKIENSGNKLIGVCSITLDDFIAIHDIKILKNNGTLFLAMPSRKTDKDTYKDIVHPISAEPRKKIEEIVFDLYEQSTRCGNQLRECNYVSKKGVSLLEQSFRDFVMVEEEMIHGRN